MPTVPRINVSIIREARSSHAGETVTIWEAGTRFGARITPAGALRWVVRYRIGGRWRESTFDAHGALSPAHAREEARNIQAEAARGIDPLEARQTDPTFGALADRYIEHHVTGLRNPGNRQTQISRIEGTLRPAWGRRTLDSITREDVARVVREKGRTAPYSANRLRALVSSMFARASEWGLHPGPNPARHVRPYREEQRTDYLTGDELAALGQALGEIETESPELAQAAAAARLLIFTGARLSEVLALRWGQVDAERARAEVTVKGGKAGRLRLSAPALAVLDAIERTPSPWVFPSRTAASGHLESVRGLTRKLAKRIGRETLRAHDLRHTYATHALAISGDARSVQALLNHSHATTTERYVHAVDERVGGVASQVGISLSELMGVSPLTPEEIDEMREESIELARAGDIEGAVQVIRKLERRLKGPALRVVG